MKQHTIILPGGYKSPDPTTNGDVGRSVTFGRRPAVADRIKIDADAQSSLEVQQVLLYARAAITSFEGVRRKPVPLSVLLQLDDTDREVLLEGYVEFLRGSLGERVAEPLDENTFLLALGLEVDGEIYDIIEFTPAPQPLTGYDEVALERQYGSGVRRELAFVSRESVALAQSEGALRVEGAVAVETLEKLDAYDAQLLLRFSGERRDSFRGRRRTSGLAGARDSGAGQTPPVV